MRRRSVPGHVRVVPAERARGEGLVTVSWRRRHCRFPLQQGCLSRQGMKAPCLNAHHRRRASCVCVCPQSLNHVVVFKCVALGPPALLPPLLSRLVNLLKVDLQHTPSQPLSLSPHHMIRWTIGENRKKCSLIMLPCHKKSASITCFGAPSIYMLIQGGNTNI
jgi:hypothetical protein